MAAIFAGFVSLALVLTGGLSLYEYTLYTDAQKSGARRLATAYLGTILVMLAVGAVGLVVAVVEPGAELFLVGIAGIVAALSTIVQHRLNRELGLESGPLITRLTQDWLGE